MLGARWLGVLREPSREPSSKTGEFAVSRAILLLAPFALAALVLSMIAELVNWVVQALAGWRIS